MVTEPNAPVENTTVEPAAGTALSPGAAPETIAGEEEEEEE